MNARNGFLYLVVVWFSWGLSYPFTAIALRVLDVWTSRCLVSGLAGIVMIGGVALTGGRVRVPREERWDLLIAAACNVAIFQVGMTYGVSLLSPGRTVVIVYTMPVWAALFAAFVLHERLTVGRCAALACGLAGLVILMDQDLSNLANAPLGAALTLMAAVSFAFGTIWMKRRRWTLGPAALAGWQLLAGTVPMLAIWLTIRPTVHWEAMLPETWVAVAFLALVSNGLAYIAWFRVVAIFPAVVSGIGTLAVPIVGVLSSAAMVGDEIGWRELVALSAVCFALALVLFSSIPSRPDWRSWFRRGVSTR